MYLLFLAGKVYNVTKFLKYHPGRKAQLMRGAGIDCTELFDKVCMYICISVQILSLSHAFND